MLESVLERKAIKKAKDRGWHTMKAGQNGKPDRLFWQRRVYAWVELKIWPNKPTPLQERKIRELKDQGEAVYVCYTVEEVLAALVENEWWRNEPIDTQGL